MGWSKATRIKVLLAIDTVFLFIELITGYAVGSLALVADSFHMLNDVMSLIVALYALNLASNTTRSNKYSYGWQRAEILGALVNGVFLLALCFSIFMEAIQRLFEAPEVGQPKLVVVVGSLGLLSNIVGLFLFHEHGHSHGGHSHSHDSKAEEGHSHAISAGNKVKQVKHKAKGALKINTGHSGVPSSSSGADERSPLLSNGTANSADPSASPLRTSRSVPIGGADTPFADDEDEVDDGLDELMVHPARTREAIVRQAYDAGFGSPRNSNDAPEISGHRRSLSLQGSIGPGGRKGRGRTASTSKPAARERSASRSSAKGPHNHEHGGVHDDGHGHDHADGDEHEHHGHEGHEHDDDHEHEHEHEHGHGDGHGHGGHDHGNMNMRGVFLHVMGDALGNVGVIAAGLIIWLTKSPYRFYSDPLISLVITIIIFSSALPLVRSASFILLQGTPAHVPLEKVRSAILRIPNVISVHDLHIWSLSESKLVASMHILVKSHTEFAVCSAEVRKVLHRFGVHSTTIQPELLDLDSSAGQAAAGIILSRQGSLDALVDGTAEGDDVGCLVQCVDDSCVDSSCCPPNVLAAAKEGALASANTKSHSNLRQNAQAGGSSKTSANGGPSYASIAASK